MRRPAPAGGGDLLAAIRARRRSRTPPRSRRKPAKVVVPAALGRRPRGDPGAENKAEAAPAAGRERRGRRRGRRRVPAGPRARGRPSVPRHRRRGTRRARDKSGGGLRAAWHRRACRAHSLWPSNIGASRWKRERSDARGWPRLGARFVCAASRPRVASRPLESRRIRISRIAISAASIVGSNRRDHGPRRRATPRHLTQVGKLRKNFQWRTPAERRREFAPRSSIFARRNKNHGQAWQK